MIRKLLTRLFGEPEELNGNRCPTYMYRWTILKFRGRGMYLHNFVGDDWSKDLHDHPKRFVSIGLRGGYIEWTPCSVCSGSVNGCGFEEQKVYNAPWIRSFPAKHIHRLTMSRSHPSGEVMPCWTLVIVLKPVRKWGFWHQGELIGWREYVNGKDGIADKMKACD